MHTSSSQPAVVAVVTMVIVVVVTFVGVAVSTVVVVNNWDAGVVGGDGGIGYDGNSSSGDLHLCGRGLYGGG